MMKTEINRSFNWGFVLTEQELRRLIQTCNEHLANKLDPALRRVRFTARLRDGSVIECDQVEDLLSLENAGSRAIQKLTLIFDDGKDVSDWGILVRFQDGDRNPASWNSVDLEIVGQSRDWAFVAASDLDERVRRVKRMPYQFILRNKWAIWLPLVAGLVLMTIVLSLIPANDGAATQLEAAYGAGTVKDPIQAMLLLEKAHEAYSPYLRNMLIMGVAWVAPLLVSWSVGKVIPIVAPSYNFYWGDYVQYYDRRRTMQFVFWSVVVLGVIVSVISAYVVRALP
jgi:hypothetical protein